MDEKYPKVQIDNNSGHCIFGIVHKSGNFNEKQQKRCCPKVRI